MFEVHYNLSEMILTKKLQYKKKEMDGYEWMDVNEWMWINGCEWMDGWIYELIKNLMNLISIIL